MKTLLLPLAAFFILTICTALNEEGCVDIVFEILKNTTDEFKAEAQAAVAEGATIVPGTDPRGDLRNQLQTVNVSQPLHDWIERFISTTGNVSVDDMYQVIELYATEEKSVFNGLRSLYCYIQNANVSDDELKEPTSKTVQASNDLSVMTSHLFMNLHQFVEHFGPFDEMGSVIAATPASSEEYKMLVRCLQLQPPRNQSHRACYPKAKNAADLIWRDIGILPAD